MIRLNPITRNRQNIVKATDKRTNKRWTDDDIRRLKELYRKGYSAVGIASILGRTKQSIYERIARERGKRP